MIHALRQQEVSFFGSVCQLQMSYYSFKQCVNAIFVLATVFEWVYFWCLSWPGGFYEKICAGPVAFVHHEYIGNLHQPGFHHLYIIARFRNEHYDSSVGKTRNLHLALTNTHCLDNDIIEFGGVSAVR